MINTFLQKNCVSTSKLLLVLNRSIKVIPSQTQMPDRFPEGYVSLQGDESLDLVYGLLKKGHYICSTKKIQHIDESFHGISRLIEAELPGVSFDDIIVQQVRKEELLSKLLIPRSFWDLSDWNDPQLYKSYGPHTVHFDNYWWSTRLHHEFKAYSEKWFPASEHTHLSYPEYMELVKYFVYQENGISLFPLLPRKYRIKPQYGVPAPNKLLIAHAELLKKWISAWKIPLALNKILCVRARSGLLPLSLRGNGVPMVRYIDPSPISTKSAQENSIRWGYNFHEIGSELVNYSLKYKN